MTDQETWQKLHDEYLECQLHRVRLLVERQVLWLRAHRWRTEPLEDTVLVSDERVDRLLARTGAGAGGAVDEPEEGAASLERSIVAHEARLRDYEDELIALGARSGLATLQHAAGLSEVEREAVLAALAVELDPSFGILYAYVQDDPSRRFAAPGLVASLLRLRLPDVWELFLPDAPSHRFRLFDRHTDGSAATPLRLDRRVVNFLRGVNHVDERLAGLVEPIADLPLPPPHEAVAERLTKWLADPDRVATHAVVNLVGPAGQGREAIAARVARSLGFATLRLRVEHLAHAGDLNELARLLDREALLLPAVLYVDAPEISGGDPTTETAAQQLMDELRALVFVGSRQRTQGRRPALSLTVPPLGPPERLKLWRAVRVETALTQAQLQELVQQFSLGPEAVTRAAAEAVGLAEMRSGVAGTIPEQQDVWAACRTFVGRELSQLARRLEPASGWDDLVLPQREQLLLREVAGQVAHRHRVYEEWGFGPRLARGRGISALFSGPPGTGKTMAAEIIAGHLDLDLYRIDLSSVVSKYIGETEKNLRRVFDAAEQGGAILFFDEADALFGKRTEVKDSHDRHANVEINYLLQRMEDYDGLAILATNRKTDLDPAFLRRIRFMVSFPFPRPEYRRRIWETVFPPQTPASDLDWDALARLEIAGGSIRNIAVNAAFLAAEADGPVSMAHVLRCTGHEYDKLDKLPSRTEFGDYYEAVKR